MDTILAREGLVSAELRPYGGGAGGGHHIPAKSTYISAPGYNLKEALPYQARSLQNLELSIVRLPEQQTLYRAFAQTGKTLTWEAVREIEIKALIQAGMNADQASVTVGNAIQKLKDAGVSAPTRNSIGEDKMPKSEIEEFAKTLIREVRDRSIADCDMLLRPEGNESACKAMARQTQHSSQKTLP